MQGINRPVRQQSGIREIADPVIRSIIWTSNLSTVVVIAMALYWTGTLHQLEIASQLFIHAFDTVVLGVLAVWWRLIALLALLTLVRDHVPTSIADRIDWLLCYLLPISQLESIAYGLQDLISITVQTLANSHYSNLAHQLHRSNRQLHELQSRVDQLSEQ